MAFVCRTCRSGTFVTTLQRSAPHTGRNPKRCVSACPSLTWLRCARTQQSSRRALRMDANQINREHGQPAAGFLVSPRWTFCGEKKRKPDLDWLVEHLTCLVPRRFGRDELGLEHPAHPCHRRRLELGHTVRHCPEQWWCRPAAPNRKAAVVPEGWSLWCV